MGILTSSEFWAIFIPAAVAVALWFVRHRQQLVWQQYKRREGLYRALLEESVGLYKSTRDEKKINAFIGRVRRSWLYAPDPVIKKANEVLDAVETNGEAKRVLGELVVEIRKDLLSGSYPTKTSLTADDYKHLQAGKPPIGA